MQHVDLGACGQSKDQPCYGADWDAEGEQGEEDREQGKTIGC